MRGRRRLPFGRKLARVTVKCGEPLDFSRYEGLSGDRFVERSITDEIMYEIMRLSGQEYVDMYAGRAKEESKESKKAPSEPDPTVTAGEAAQKKAS